MDAGAGKAKGEALVDDQQVMVAARAFEPPPPERQPRKRLADQRGEAVAARRILERDRTFA